MTKTTPEREKGPTRDAAKRPRKLPAQPTAAPAEPKIDIVDEAGKESFPASDAPSWTP